MQSYYNYIVMLPYSKFTLDHVHLLSDGTTVLFGCVHLHFVLLKRHLEASFSFHIIFSLYNFHSYTFHLSIRILFFIRILFSFTYFSFVPFIFIRILFYICLLLIRILFIRILFFIGLLLIRFN